MNPIIIALAGFGTGAAAAWLWRRGREAALQERLRLREEEAAKLEIDLAAARAAREDLAALRASTAASKAADERLLAEQERRNAQALADLERVRASLQAEFEAAAGRIFEEKSTRFAEKNDALLHPLRQQLADFRARIDTVYKTESDDRAALRGQIEQLRQLNGRITDETRVLTQALKGQAQARGAWGELVLERLLEGSGLRRGEDYAVQESLAGADGRRLRPDVIVRLPNQGHLVIDSKVSLVDYERAVAATDEAARRAASQAHAAAMRGHVKDLAGKKYSDAAGLFSPDYVFMFVPIEPAFALALETDPALYEWAFEQRVVIAPASSLLVALKAAFTLWLQDRQSRNVQEIAKRGGLLYDKFVGLYEELAVVGQHLDKARASHGEVLSRLKDGKGNLLSQVETLKTLGAKTQKSLPAPDSEET